MEKESQEKQPIKNSASVSTLAQKLLLGSIFLCLYTTLLFAASAGGIGENNVLEYLNLLLLPVLYFVLKTETRVTQALTKLEGHDRRLELLEEKPYHD